MDGEFGEFCPPQMGWRSHNTGIDRLKELLYDLIIFYSAERRQA
jgi:hypothetical protein